MNLGKIDEFFNFRQHSFNLDAVKQEIENIVITNNSKIVEWEIKDDYAVFFDDNDHTGMVFKTEKDAIKQIYTSDDIWEEIDALEQTLTNVDILVENGIDRNEAERLVKNGNLEKTYKRLISIAGPEITYGESYDLKNGYVLYYPNPR